MITALHPVSGPASPVTFSGMAGLFQPAERGLDTAVLFVSPWGLEDMCARKFWRVLAEEIAALGVASLRFDLPATGDSLDPETFEDGLSLWDDAIVEAALRLGRLSGAARILPVGMGLGAMLALRNAGRINGLAGIAALAPVVSGRAYLRELSVTARMVNESLGLPGDYREGTGVAIAGFTMPDAIAAGLRGVDLMKMDTLPACPILIGERASRPADGELFAFLSVLGGDVRRVPFDGYDALTGNPATSIVPKHFAATVAAWVAEQAIPFGPRSGVSEAPEGGVRDGGHFIEVPVQFAGPGPLHGVLTRPACERLGATVLFLSTAYDRHAGWGRSTAQIARDLARQGIASLRFDGANVADSPPAPGEPDQVLYTQGQGAAVEAALGVLSANDFGPVIVAGRCSGAYLAFRMAAEDVRIAGAVAANPPLFHWNPAYDIDALLRSTPRALGDYGQRLLQWSTVSRLIRGEIDLGGALLNITRAVSRRLFAPLAIFSRRYTAEGRDVHAAFHAISSRGAKLRLVYSDTDPGLDQFAAYFGADGQHLRDYPGAAFSTIGDADHNLTPQHARQAYRDAIASLALSFSVTH